MQKNIPTRQQLARSNEEEIWSTIRALLRDSNCLKTQTAAAIVRDGKILSFGFNLCAPGSSSYGDALEACPRTLTKTGTGYELCSPIHAEVMACLNIRHERTSRELGRYAGHIQLPEKKILAAFTSQELEVLNGSSLWLVGHYWACDNCQDFLRVVGVADIRIDKLTGDATRGSYKRRKLT